MKKFYLNVLGLAIALLVISCASPVSSKKVVHIVSNPWELSATIKIPDFSTNLKIMQITDAHISIEDERESDFMGYAERMHQAYLTPRKHFLSDINKTTFEYLDDLLLQAKNENVELLLLTGDIVNFPSAVSAKYVYDRLMKTGIPWLYIAGNHDWYYEGMPGSQDSLRKTWIEKSLRPLFNGHNPLYYSEIISGINFIGIDNSTGEISDQQVDFLKDQLKLQEPIVILSHIPYNLNDSTNQPEMSALTDIISSNCDKIVAIFAGHIHRSSFYFVGNLCQYTSLASFQGGTIVVDIMPNP